MNLKTIRNSSNKTQTEVANACGLTLRSYQNYESQAREMNYETLIKLADYFDCSVDYLIGHNNPNIIRLDLMTEPKRQLLELMMPMSDEQVYSLIGYAARLKEYPIEDIIEKIKKGV